MKFKAIERIKHIEPGTILLSEPYIDDPNFGRSVILISDVNESGCVGFMLNKPIGEITIQNILDGFELSESDVFVGGPVEQDMLHFLYRSEKGLPRSIHIVDDLYLGGDFEKLKLAVDVGEIREASIRFFVGYAGWDEGQLEEELQGGAWYVTKTTTSEIMDLEPTTLWSTILKSMGGRYQMISNYPLDPRMN